jgi:anti-anti-sigma factor
MVKMPADTIERLWIELDGDFWGNDALSLAERLPLSELAGAKLVVLSLGKVRRIDEAGLAMLVRLYSHLRVRGSRLQLVDVPVSVQQLLERIGFSPLVAGENGVDRERADHTIELGARIEA